MLVLSGFYVKLCYKFPNHNREALDKADQDGRAQ